MGRQASARLQWLVAALDVQPHHRLLEIGCGHGVAVSLVCEKLVEGEITAIDRSPTMVQMARRRNAAAVASGRATILTAAFPDVDLGIRRFDTILAMHVGFFWKQQKHELHIIREWLTSEGTFFYAFQPLAAGEADVLATKGASIMRDAGFRRVTVVSETIKGGPVIGLAGTP